MIELTASVLKMWMDGQMDKQLSFQLYILNFMTECNKNHAYYVCVCAVKLSLNKKFNFISYITTC